MTRRPRIASAASLAALGSLLVATTTALAQSPAPQPPAAASPGAQAPAGQPPAGGPGGRRFGMPPSEKAKKFTSASLGAEVTYVAYVPADYETSKASYPVIYALHGMFENHAFLERRGVLAQYEEAVKAGVAPNAIVVAVDGGNNLFVNSPKGRYVDLVAKDLVAEIDANYRTIARPAGRALLGVSMGGYGALNIAFTRPGVFGAVATHSAMLLSQIPTAEMGARGGQMAAFTGVFGNPIDEAAWKAADPLELAKSADPKSLPALYLDCGSEDRFGLFTGNRMLHETLEAKKVAHGFGLYPGDHGYEYVKTVFPKSLAFLKEKLAAK
jgi:S-formylglutathione hydrolase FrmB